VAFPRDETAYLQLALKLNPDVATAEAHPVVLRDLERDPVVG
jgi:hypothetical protein